MTNGQRGWGSSFLRDGGMLKNISTPNLGLGDEENPRLPWDYSVANPTGYSWRVALPHCPLPLHRLKRSLKLNGEGVKKKSSNLGLTGVKESETIA